MVNQGFLNLEPWTLNGDGSLLAAGSMNGNPQSNALRSGRNKAEQGGGIEDDDEDDFEDEREGDDGCASENKLQA